MSEEQESTQEQQPEVIETSCKPEEIEKRKCDLDLVLFLPDDSEESLQFATMLANSELSNRIDVVVAQDECEELARREGVPETPYIMRYKNCQAVGGMPFTGDFEKDMERLKELASD